MSECILAGRKGDKGDTGPKGATGATGPQGPAGSSSGGCVMGTLSGPSLSTSYTTIKSVGMTPVYVASFRSTSGSSQNMYLTVVANGEDIVVSQMSWYESTYSVYMRISGSSLQAKYSGSTTPSGNISYLIFFA